MDTRSRKSRSRTPFTAEQFSQEFLDKETLAENSVKVTRKTTVYKTKEVKANSVDEITSTIKSNRRSAGSERAHVKWHKTSDYSSEEGENDVSSTRTISQNEKNQIIEDARAAANGSSGISALDLYKKSGRYWEIYPKTDYTYSPISKDRVEIAPGVIAMPNMSRNSIHSVHSDSFSDFQDKETNTESYLSKRSLDQNTNYVSRQLFNNGYKNSGYSRISRTRSDTFWSRTRTTIITTFTRIVTTVTSILYFGIRTQKSLLAKVHKLSSKVMIWDAWLLWKNNPGNKATRLAALCIIPLLLFGGWWLLATLGSLLDNSKELKVPAEENILHPIQNENFIKKQVQDENITPHVDLRENEIFIHQQKLINDLNEEVINLKAEILKADKTRRDDLNRILSILNTDTGQKNVPIIYRVNRCCKTPIIDMEKYVNRILVNLLNDPEFLKDQKGLTNYLNTIFVARQELELNLNNLTTNLDSKYNDLIKDSTLRLMDEVTSKIKLEISKQSKQVDYGSVDVSNVSDDHVKKIVRSILALYDADRTGLVDYAMESMGAQILSTRCTENYHYGKAVVSVLGIPLWYPVNSPRTLITPGISPGQCWAFQNFPGFVMIRLSKRIKIEAFSIEHISRLLVPNGEIDSAPKEFEIYGLTDEYDKEPLLLGAYTYDYDGESLQFFDVQKDDQVFEIIELRIFSNHGNPNYTCLYRFRVHGKTV